MSIATELARIQTAKENITRALARIGHEVPSGSTLDEYAQYIDPYTSGHTIEWLDNPNNYLRFKFVTDGNVSWQNVKGDIQYSKNGGSTWTNFNGSVVECNGGDEIWFKGTLTGGCGASNFDSSSIFNTTGKFYAVGNILSLCSFNNTLVNYHFAYLFHQCVGLNIENNTALVLPATTLAGYCYRSMFYGCTSLTIAPELPATTLASYCYQNMFANCTSLTTAPELPATTLELNCYQLMFAGCTSLTTAPELPATTLASSCYQQMFQGCTSLTTAPSILPATTLASYCYAYMFRECTSLTTAPELPATTLAENCYSYMFSGCRSLTSAPELPATTLANSCYSSMFSGCRSLTSAPSILPATTLATSCYDGMFSSCTNLNYVVCLATDISAIDCTYNWLKGVANLGTFVKNDKNRVWVTGETGIPTGWNVENYYGKRYFTFIALEDGTFKFSGSTGSNTLSYSLDNGETWVALAHNTNTPTVQSGKTIMWKGTPTPSTSGIGIFISSGRFNAENNSMSLLFGDNFSGQTSLASKSTALMNLFAGNTNIINTENVILPATTLSLCCYNFMFSGCTNLISAPELPATTMANGCYGRMFAGCTSLSNAPALPAETLDNWCYSEMFSGCTSLITAPELPAETLVTGCYYAMFYGCTNLNYIKCAASSGISETNCTTNWVSGVSDTGTFVLSKFAFVVASTPATNGWIRGVNGIPTTWRPEYFNPYGSKYLTFVACVDNVKFTFTKGGTNSMCYSIDNGVNWISLSNNTQTPAINSGESMMFKGVAPTNAYSDASGKISSTGKFNAQGNIMSIYHGDNFRNNIALSGYAFQNLFSGNTYLNEAENLILPATTLTDYCYANMFRGCTGLTTAPEYISATTLGNYCCQYMFYSCTTLSLSPILCAPTLVNNCYSYMFQSCSNLSQITCLATNPTTSFTNNWVSGVPTSGTRYFFKHSSVTSWTRGNSGIPSNWTVRDF